MVIPPFITMLSVGVCIIAIAESDHPIITTLAVGVCIIAIADGDHHPHHHARCRRLHHRHR
jgi:hypothetical protein